MADIVSEIISDIQSDIDGGYYDPDTFDLYEAIWQTLDDKLIYTHKIIEYWESVPGYASDEITRLMTEEITEYVSGSISEGDLNFPDNFTANRRAMRARPADRRRMANARRRANRRPARPANHRARRKIAQEYNGWFNWDTWATYGSITADYGDYQRGIRATLSGNPLDLIAVFEDSVYREPDVDVSKVDWDEVYLALDEEN